MSIKSDGADIDTGDVQLSGAGAVSPNAKPYDDEMLEAYEQESEAEGSQEEVPEEDVLESPEKQEGSEKGELRESKETPQKDPSLEESLESTTITRALGDKEVQFTVKQAIDAFLGQEEFNRNMDRRIGHVRHLEKRWEADQNTFKDKIGGLVEAARDGDFISAIRGIAKIATAGTDLDVVEFEKQYFEQLDKIHEVQTKMTPEQREAFWAKRQAAEAKARAKKLEDGQAKQSAVSQLGQQVAELRQRSGVEEAEFWQSYETLAEEAVGEGKFFKTKDDISPQDVINFTLRVKHETKVSEAGKKLGISDEGLLDHISRVTAADPSLTVEEIVSVIEKSGVLVNASPESVENLNRKAQSSGAQFRQASSTKKENGKIEGYDDESLEFLYRNQPRQYTRVVR